MMSNYTFSLLLIIQEDLRYTLGDSDISSLLLADAGRTLLVSIGGGSSLMALRRTVAY